MLDGLSKLSQLKDFSWKYTNLILYKLVWVHITRVMCIYRFSINPSSFSEQIGFIEMRISIYLRTSCM